MNHTPPGTHTGADARASLTPGKGLLVLLAIVILVAAFIWMTHALGISQAWPGFLFILYWAGLEHVQMERLAPSVVGALAGFGIGWAMHVLPPLLGVAGWAIVLGTILVAIYCHVMGWLPVVVNMATMLFLTVGTVPAVQEHADLTDAFAALLCGMVFIVVLVVGGKWVAGRFGRKPA